MSSDLDLCSGSTRSNHRNFFLGKMKSFENISYFQIDDILRLNVTNCVQLNPG
jgi:hypothetical protein